jgi:hypothetical protein
MKEEDVKAECDKNSCPVCGKKCNGKTGFSNHLFKIKDVEHINFVNKIKSSIVGFFEEETSRGKIIEMVFNKFKFTIGCNFVYCILKTIPKYKQMKKENSLLCKYPELCKDWDYEKNELGPDNYSYGSAKKVWWMCPLGHSWEAAPSTRIKGHGCPYCSGRKVLKENSLLYKYPELCKEWDYEKNEFGPENYLRASNTKIWWKCSKGHSWEAFPGVRVAGHNCPCCDGQRASFDNNITLFYPIVYEYWDYEKNKLDPENYLSHSGQEVYWKCKNNHTFKCSVSVFMKRKNKCFFCLKYGTATEKYNLLLNFPELCKEWDYEKNLDPQNYTPFSHKKVWWKCSKGHNWECVIKNRTINGTCCPECFGKSVSILCTNWLDGLNIKKENREISVINYKVDGLQNNVVYEFLGDFWHGNPSLYSPNDKNRVTNDKYGLLLYKTILRLNEISQHYKIIYCWENENKNKIYKPIVMPEEDILKQAENIYNKYSYKDILEGT